MSLSKAAAIEGGIDWDVGNLLLQLLSGIGMVGAGLTKAVVAIVKAIWVNKKVTIAIVTAASAVLAVLSPTTAAVIGAKCVSLVTSLGLKSAGFIIMRLIHNSEELAKAIASLYLPEFIAERVILLLTLIWAARAQSLLKNERKKTASLKKHFNSYKAQNREGESKGPDRTIIAGGSTDSSHEARFAPIDKGIAVKLLAMNNKWRFPNDTRFQSVFDQVSTKGGSVVEAELKEITSPHVSLKYGITDAGSIEEMWSDFGFEGPHPRMTSLNLAALVKLVLNLKWDLFGSKDTTNYANGSIGVLFSMGKTEVHPEGGIRISSNDHIVTIMKKEAAERMYIKDPWYVPEGKLVQLHVRPFRFALKDQSDIGWNLNEAVTEDGGRWVEEVYVQGFVELNKTGIAAEARAAVMTMAKSAPMPQKLMKLPPIQEVVLFDEGNMAQDILITVRYKSRKQQSIMDTRVMLKPTTAVTSA